jgi:hypothetical protein
MTAADFSRACNHARRFCTVSIVTLGVNGNVCGVEGDFESYGLRFLLALFCTPVFAQWWNPFAPSDYEECSESAARTAKTNEALKILISACASKFVGRRKVGGGYTYFDPRQNRSFDISGPNPTHDEVKRIDADYAAQVKADIALQAQQAEASRQLERELEEDEAKRRIYAADMVRQAKIAAAELARRTEIAAGQVRASPNHLECLYPALQSCEDFDLTVTVKNSSTETVKSFELGWTFISEDTTSCPNSIPGKTREDIRLRSNGTTVINIKGHDGSKSLKSRICVGITALDISP